MALDTFTPNPPPSPGTKLSRDIKTRKAEFGDGYTQEGPDGSNPIKRKISLTWDVLLPEQQAAIVTFLEGHITTPFYYTPANGITRKWKCVGVEETFDTPFTLTANLEQYFGLEA
ncbi:phage tail protein [Bradyrhizobium sp. USDA 4504]